LALNLSLKKKRSQHGFSLERELRVRISIHISLKLIFRGSQCMIIHVIPGLYPDLPGIPTLKGEMSFSFLLEKVHKEA
jgi:hypothetical protein